VSWFKKAYNISQVEPNSYYSVVSPIRFYEWRYTGVIPKGTKCSKRLPPSDIIAYNDEKLVVSIIANSDQLKPQEGNFILAEDIRSPVVLKIGQLQNPREILQRYGNLLDEFRRKFEDFKTTASTQEYLISRHDNPQLYRISSQDNDEVKIENFGSIRDISKNITELRKILSQQSQQKKGRAYEIADLRKVENIYTYIGNVGIPIDPTRFQLLIRKSNIKPQTARYISWRDCYFELNPEAKEMDNRINHFQSFSWAKAALSANHHIS